jgi:hypothetical protein
MHGPMGGPGGPGGMMFGMGGPPIPGMPGMTMGMGPVRPSREMFEQMMAHFGCKVRIFLCHLHAYSTAMFDL